MTEWIGDIQQWFGGIGAVKFNLITLLLGGVGGFAASIPLFLRLGREVRAAKEVTEEIFIKYKDGALPTVLFDLKRLLRAWDSPTETLANALRFFRLPWLKKAADALSALIKPEYYN